MSPKPERGPLRRNTPAEEAAIQAGIDADPDNPEWTDADVAEARGMSALLDAAEDRADRAAFDAYDADVGARGRDAVLAEALPVALARRILDGESSVRVWREHRGTSQSALAAAAGVSAPYLNEIERGRKPGSAAALSRIAVALGVGMEALVGGGSKD